MRGTVRARSGEILVRIPYSLTRLFAIPYHLRKLVNSLMQATRCRVLWLGYELVSCKPPAASRRSTLFEKAVRFCQYQILCYELVQKKNCIGSSSHMQNSIQTSVQPSYKTIYLYRTYTSILSNPHPLSTVHILTSPYEYTPYRIRYSRYLFCHTSKLNFHQQCLSKRSPAMFVVVLARNQSLWRSVTMYCPSQSSASNAAIPGNG